MGATESRESSGEGENGGGPSNGAAAAAAIAGLAALACRVASLLSGSTSSKGKEKTMKAPGRNQRIVRADFEKNPKDYFKTLRE